MTKTKHHFLFFCYFPFFAASLFLLLLLSSSITQAALLTVAASDNRAALNNFDALNRTTKISTPDQIIQYIYDQGANARGKLSGFASTVNIGTAAKPSAIQQPSGKIGSRVPICATLLRDYFMISLFDKRSRKFEVAIISTSPPAP